MTQSCGSEVFCRTLLSDLDYRFSTRDTERSATVLPPPLKPCTAASFSKYGYFLGWQILVSLTELNCVYMYLGQLHWPYLVGVTGFQMV